MEIKELLPLGSIVVLKQGSKRIMICARYQLSKRTKKFYDYGACYYPEGLIESDKLFMFQHEDIERVIFKGFQDQEEVDFIAKINQILTE